MRCKFDQEKSRSVKRKHGISLEQAEEIFDQVYLVDQKSDVPNSFVQSVGAADTSVP
jgi:uncharacterized DUF497 family protein